MEYEENEGVLQQFLAESPEFELMDINSRLPSTLRGSTPFVRIYPGGEGLDGFFIAVMKRQVLE
jgi:16S rRNA C967 or C1407 C5-methylase (RsmB/RsmF family)